MTADEATDAMPEDPREELRLELGEARKALHAGRARGFDALVIDAGSGEELLTGAALAMKELRLELDEAREALHAIRTGGFDALVIDAGRGEEVFALAGTGRPYRLLVESSGGEGSATSGRWPSTSTAPWLMVWSRPPRWPRSPRRGPGGSG